MNKHASFNKIGSLAGNPAGIVAISGISGVEIAPVIGAGIDKGIKQGLVIVPEKKTYERYGCSNRLFYRAAGKYMAG